MIGKPKYERKPKYGKTLDAYKVTSVKVEKKGSDTVYAVGISKEDGSLKVIYGRSLTLSNDRVPLNTVKFDGDPVSYAYDYRYMFDNLGEAEKMIKSLPKRGDNIWIMDVSETGKSVKKHVKGYHFVTNKGGWHLLHMLVENGLGSGLSLSSDNRSRVPVSEIGETVFLSQEDVQKAFNRIQKNDKQNKQRAEQRINNAKNR